MAFSRGGTLVSAPRLLTVAASVILVVLALASMRVHLPSIQPYVAPHRFALVVAGWAVLLVGVLLRRF